MKTLEEIIELSKKGHNVTEELLELQSRSCWKCKHSYDFRGWGKCTQHDAPITKEHCCEKFQNKEPRMSAMYVAAQKSLKEALLEGRSGDSIGFFVDGVKWAIGEVKGKSQKESYVNIESGKYYLIDENIINKIEEDYLEV